MSKANPRLASTIRPIKVRDNNCQADFTMPVERDLLFAFARLGVPRLVVRAGVEDAVFLAMSSRFLLSQRTEMVSFYPL